ncbi:hypothetical protein GGC63_004118 [Paenibacillus sp. OAS669]|nr:hypothetical protein [Paenibacillus sp. OAS669]
MIRLNRLRLHIQPNNSMDSIGLYGPAASGYFRPNPAHEV